MLFFVSEVLFCPCLVLIVDAYGRISLYLLGISEDVSEGDDNSEDKTDKSYCETFAEVDACSGGSDYYGEGVNC